MKRYILSRLFPVFATITLAAAFTVSSATAQTSHTVTIENQSSYDIYHVYVSPVWSGQWGPDELGRNILSSGDRAELRHEYYRGSYDLKLVDEDNDVCEVKNVALTGETNWVITDRWLLNCEFRQ